MRGRRWAGAVSAVGLLILGGYWLSGPAASTARSTPPACALDNSPVPSTFIERAGGRLVGIASFGTWGTSPCLLRAQLTFRVERFKRDGQGKTVRAVEGNPAARVVDYVLKPGAVVVASWQWRNWCGPSGRFQLQALWGKPWFSATGSIAPPACSSRGQRSTLSPARVRLHECSPDGYTFAPGLGQGFMETLITGVAISLRPHQEPCALQQVRVAFAVQGQTGGRWVVLHQIENDPGYRMVGAVLATGEPAQLFWAWGNWCDKAVTRFRAWARVGNRVVTGRASSSSPYCFGHGAPSALMPSYGY